MTETVYSNHVERKAVALLQQRDQWRHLRNKETGVSFMTVPSGERMYRVHPRGLGCSCDAMQKWNASICSHARAVQLANAEDAAAEQAAPVSFRSYQDLYPGCIDGCGDLAEKRNARCYACEQKHVRRLEQESKRAAVMGG